MNKSTSKRLENEIKWYSDSSKRNQKYFKGIQVLVVVVAAFIPFLASFDLKIITASAGVLIVVLQGLQSLFQFQEHWISYRSTAESLKHEKFLFLAKAGPYNSVKEPDKLLAERVESLISQEHSKWIVNKDKLNKK